jgi:chaperonin cofactor prefoldin
MSNGLEKQRCVYFNKILDQLRSHKETRTSAEILGIIDTSWTLKRVELAQLQLSELETKEQNLKTVHSEYFNRNRQANDWTSVTKNVEKLEFAKFMVQKHYKELICPVNSNSKKDTEKKLDGDITTLKNALSALEKSFSQTFKRLETMSNDILNSYINTECSSGFDPGTVAAPLGTNEEAVIAQEMLAEEAIYNNYVEPI